MSVRYQAEITLTLTCHTDLVPITLDVPLYNDGGLITEFEDPDGLKFDCETHIERALQNMNQDVEGIALTLAGLAAVASLASVIDDTPVDDTPTLELP